MGASYSWLFGSDNVIPRRLDRNTFYERHPGLHNKPIGGIESEITRKPKACKHFYYLFNLHF
jgi:hypothetical protein